MRWTLADYEANFRRLFGDARMDAAIGSVEGRVRFFGLTRDQPAVRRSWTATSACSTATGNCTRRERMPLQDEPFDCRRLIEQ